MRQSLKAGFLSCAIFICLTLLLFGYQAIVDLSPTEPTASNPTQSSTTQSESSSSVPDAPSIPDPPSFTLQSSYAFVYDSVSGQLLYHVGNMDKQLAPASLTKLFTAYAALQILLPDTVITVGDEVNLIVPGSSIAHVDKGYQLTVEECIEGMLLQSGNDTSYILAVAAGREIQKNPSLSAKTAVSIFMNYVNLKLEEWGLKNTHFVNPDGIDAAGHYSTMQDMLAMSMIVLKTPLLAKYCAMAKDRVTLAGGQVLEWKNTNELLNPSSNYYRENACGLKTGTTTNAGNCLLSAFSYNGGYLIIGTLGSADKNGRYDDTLLLYDYYSIHLDKA